jgi:hypothetical protein
MTRVCLAAAVAIALMPAAGAVANFVNVTATAAPGSGGVLAAGNACWADYNNDGWVDLNLGSNLLRNNRNGTFSYTSGTDDNSIWGDYDNDGDVDLFEHAGRLLRNNGGAGFSVVGTLSGMPPVSRGATWADLNGDRYLDLYVGGYESGDSSVYYADVIYTNNRNGTFTRTWTEPINTVTTPGYPRPGRGVASADWDRDGDIDVYVSNYRLEPNSLWQNNGSGSITDVGGPKNAQAGNGHSIGAVWGDFNNDGHLDLFAGQFAHSGQPQSRFLRNRGPANAHAFQDMGTGGVFYQESYASPTAGDIDNDGDLDLYFTTVYGAPDYPRLFRNNGNFSFSDITASWGLPLTGTTSTYQGSFGDYDGDGYLDLVTANKLYRNTGGSNHWLKVKFDSDNLFDATAIGTQVRIQWNGQTLTRQVDGAVGEGNQNDHTLHFGLGSFTGSLRLEVQWADGTLHYVDIGGVDQAVTIAYPGPQSWWTFDGAGDWETDGNWLAGAPNAIGHGANFGPAITAARTITTSTPVTVGSFYFENANGYRIAGGGSITLQVATGAGSVQVTQGNHAIDVPLTFASSADVNIADGASLSIGGSTTIKAGRTVAKRGNLEVRAPLTLESGATMVIESGPTRLRGAPALGSGAFINLKSNDLIIDYAGAPATVAAVVAQLDSGHASGGWNGPGINTSSAIAGHRGLGWQNQTAFELILVRYAYYGDANLDGNVTIADLGLLATNWQSGGTWSTGDFDYSGYIDITDLGLLATNWQAGVGSPLKPMDSQPWVFVDVLASLGLPISAVPEPPAISIAIGVATFVSRVPRSTRSKKQSLPPLTSLTRVRSLSG